MEAEVILNIKGSRTLPPNSTVKPDTLTIQGWLQFSAASPVLPPFSTVLSQTLNLGDHQQPLFGLTHFLHCFSSLAMFYVLEERLVVRFAIKKDLHIPEPLECLSTVPAKDETRFCIHEVFFCLLFAFIQMVPCLVFCVDNTGFAKEKPRQSGVSRIAGYNPPPK